MRNYFRISRGDAIAFAIATLLYVGLVVVWSFVLKLPENASFTLARQKDLLFYGMWVTAGLYAVLGTALTIGALPISRRERTRGMVESLLAVAIPFGVAFGAEVVGELLVLPFLSAQKWDILIPAVQLGIAGLLIVVSSIFAVRGAAQPGQPVVRTYIRLGMGLTFIPTIAFAVSMLHYDWAGPTRGVALGNAMFHGINWAAFYVWLVGANLLDKTATTAPVAKH